MDDFTCCDRCGRSIVGPDRRRRTGSREGLPEARQDRAPDLCCSTYFDAEDLRGIASGEDVSPWHCTLMADHEGDHFALAAAGVPELVGSYGDCGCTFDFVVEGEPPASTGGAGVISA